MKAIVFHGVGDIRLADMPEPKLEQPTDAIVRITASAICGTDLHMIRGTLPGMRSGTILGHEGVGIIEQIGAGIRNLNVGDRVVIPSTIACGNCLNCRRAEYAQCDTANPNGKDAGTSFFGGPAISGPFHGLQAEKARVPFAQVGLVKLRDEVTDDQAIMLSDIFPTGYYGAELAQVGPGKAVTVLGCGPVGQFAIASAKLKDAGRIFAIDCIPDRLAMARAQGAETINYEVEDPVEVLKELTRGLGTDCVIDAVGVDANHPHKGPGAHKAKGKESQYEAELREVAPQTNPQGDQWKPGDAPSQALEWAVECVMKTGSVGIIGVYPHTDRFFPIGKAMNKNLQIRMGNCNHRRYIPHLLNLVAAGMVNPEAVLSRQMPLTSALEAYESFEKKEAGWMKVELGPVMH